MEWAELYSASEQPTEEQISDFIGNPLWTVLNDFLQESYGVLPKYSYSCCSMQAGWNVKYQKAGRALCTLYPMKGFFTALVVIGAKEEFEAGLLAPTLSDYVQGLINSTGMVMGGRWLMINVTDERILEDIKSLIQLRRKFK